ncbi:FkbM family methyltransferase [Nocardioides limicola]|uniref:FkbM family methyltransferase n=1 Tax=Nocardioides limicola TaxID=2803368 RepID=UPI00193B758D|nr:FkbM family methyltransferase [Nocardioides sp. DJM-14]
MRPPSYALRRVRQTLRFANGPSVLLAMASSRSPWPRAELTFRTRSGAAVATPNVAGARLAVYEHFVEDTYRLGDLTAGLRPDFHVLDVGSQVGAFAVAIARHSPQAHVHAYEASPETAEWLQRNVAGNDLGDRIHPHAVAISDHDGTLEFADLGAASVHNGITAPGDTATMVTVPCATMATAVALAGGRVEVVKMDAEGAEYDAVLSSPEAIWAPVQRVVMEYHPVPGHSVEELVDFFARVGLDLVQHRPEGRPGLGLAWFSRGA